MNHNESRKKSKQEKIGFYIALSVCLVAVGLAAWSTFDSVSKYIEAGETDASITVTLAPVEKDVTGITETDVKPTEPMQGVNSYHTDPAATDAPETDASEKESTGETEDVLQTLLRVTENLQYPISGNMVTQQYCENAIRNETMNDWRSHPGVDFGGEKGDDVLSMCNGIVRDVYSDEMLGNVVLVENEEILLRYCGLDNIKVDKGDDIFTGNVIGAVGTVPFEEKDKSHIHVEIIVNNRYIDPISVIGNDR